MRWEEMNTQVAPPSCSVNLSTCKICAPEAKTGGWEGGRKGGREEGRVCTSHRIFGTENEDGCLV